jgi:polyhydroxyalkanoate synthesis regulator protein
MQGLMGSYLERSIFAFHEAQKRFQEQTKTLYGELPKGPVDAWGQQIPNVMGGYLEKGAKAVIDMQEDLRNQALKLFSGFPFPNAPGAGGEEAKPRAKAGKGAARKPRARK